MTMTAASASAREFVGVLKLRQTDATTPGYVNDLNTQGFTVVKGVLSPAKAKTYSSRAYDWLESFGTGFDRHDRETWNVRNLPPHSK